MVNSEKKITPFKWLISIYIGTALFFMTLYSMPISQTNHIPLIDILFLSSSGMSVTGLSTFDISTELTRTGQLILLLQMQLGGIGIMVAFAYIFLFLGKRASLPQLVLMTFDQNQKKIKSIRNLTLLVLLIAFVCEAVGFLFMFPVIHNMYPEMKDALFITAFHSVSSFTGAGFDLFGNSLIDFQTHQLFTMSTALLIFMGSIGFPVIIELLSNRKKKSLFTKVNLSVHFSLLLFGLVAFFILELTNSQKDMSIVDRLSNSVFLSITSRNGGLSIVDTSSLHPATLLILLSLMFIGASSSSCGGGIRTTTFAVLLSKLWCTVKGSKDTILFKKRVPEEDVNKAILVFFLFTFFFFTSTVVMASYENFSIGSISFEVMSAITTTGLSMGITDDLSWFSKIWLAILMIIGRVGVIAFIYLFMKNKKTESRYVQEHLIVG